MLAHLWTVALRSATDTARILVLCIVLVETLELIINGSIRLRHFSFHSIGDIAYTLIFRFFPLTRILEWQSVNSGMWRSRLESRIETSSFTILVECEGFLRTEKGAPLNVTRQLRLDCSFMVLYVTDKM